MPNVLSLGDENTVTLALRNRTNFSLKLTIIDELPFQLQRRDFDMRLVMQADEKKEVFPEQSSLACSSETQVGDVARRFRQLVQHLEVDRRRLVAFTCCPIHQLDEVHERECKLAGKIVGTIQLGVIHRV